MNTWLRDSWLRIGALLALTVVLNACGGIPVSTDYDPEWSLQPSATYAWMSAPPKRAADPLIDNDLLARRVHRAVDQELEAKGLRQAPEAQADLLVTYHVGEEEKLDVSTFHSSFGYYPCWHCYGPGFDSDVWVTQYTQGKLVIDIVDAKTRQLVWRGLAARRLPTFRSPAERDTYIRETVSAIFKRFPSG